MDKYPISAQSLEKHYQVNGKQLGQQYKDSLSDYSDWDQKEHADEWMLFPENMGSQLSLDETSLSNGELYTILTNKSAKGKKGSIVAMIKGTRADVIINRLLLIPSCLRDQVVEITLDMASSMNLIVKHCFIKAQKVIDRFHVQKLAYDALQEMRIKHRWEAINDETNKIDNARWEKSKYIAETFENGDTAKQLLARSRYLLFKSQNNWTVGQKKRAKILFSQYPDLEKAYKLTHNLRLIFAKTNDKNIAYTKLARWYNEVSESNFKSFNTISATIYTHYTGILNFFNNRSTNAAAESFNAKLKAFRASLRGVTDIKFFLFRVTKIFA